MITISAGKQYTEAYLLLFCHEDHRALPHTQSQKDFILFSLLREEEKYK